MLQNPKFSLLSLLVVVAALRVDAATTSIQQETNQVGHIPPVLHERYLERLRDESSKVFYHTKAAPRLRMEALHFLMGLALAAVGVTFLVLRCARTLGSRSVVGSRARRLAQGGETPKDSCNVRGRSGCWRGLARTLLACAGAEEWRCGLLAGKTGGAFYAILQKPFPGSYEECCLEKYRCLAMAFTRWVHSGCASIRHLRPFTAF